MASFVPTLPPHQASALALAYSQARASARRTTVLGLVLLAVAVVTAGYVAEVKLGVLLANVGRLTSYVGRIFVLDSGAIVFTDIAEWYWGFWKWLKLIGETLVIAYLGTLAGFLGGFVLCFLAASNLALGRASLFVTRRVLEFCRTVPEIVFALIFVVAFGLGALPGVLALAIHTMGALGKQFFEVVENIDMKPVEGVAAAGGSWTEQIRFAVLPQVLSNLVSYTLLRFEINVRSAAVMGFVGAGGIGQDLLEAVRKFYYSDVSGMLLMIIATVVLIDLVTERLRHRLIGARG